MLKLAEAAGAETCSAQAKRLWQKSTERGGTREKAEETSVCQFS
jgi:hypothetical protein